MTLVASFEKPPMVMDLPSIPIEAFYACGIVPDLHLMMVPSSIGTVFGA